MSSSLEATPSSKSSPSAVYNSSSPVASVPETPPSNTVSHTTPTRMRSPLSDIGNRCGSRVSGSSPLSKHLQPVPIEKATKTGHARVLTSAKKRDGKRSRKLKKRKQERESVRGRRLRGRSFSKKRKGSVLKSRSRG